MKDYQSNKGEELINNPDNRDNKFYQEKLGLKGHCCIIIDHKENKVIKKDENNDYKYSTKKSRIKKYNKEVLNFDQENDYKKVEKGSNRDKKNDINHNSKEEP